MLQQFATIHPVLPAVVGSLALLLGAALADLVTTSFVPPSSVS